MVKAPARREVVRHMVDHGLSERHALRVVDRRASAYRYQPAPDHNQALREQIVAWHIGIAVMVPSGRIPWLPGGKLSRETGMERRRLESAASRAIQKRIRRARRLFIGRTETALEQVFSRTDEITLPYYLELYRNYAGLTVLLGKLGLDRFVFPSVYFLGRK